MDNEMYEWNMICYATIEKKKKVNVMYTPKFSLSLTLLFSFLFILLQSYAGISTMLTYARHSTRYTYTFFSYATCEWSEIFIQNKVLFCSVLSFNSHISEICKNASKQLAVLNDWRDLTNKAN